MNLNPSPRMPRATRWLALLLLLTALLPARAQWVDQEVSLQTGWSAVFLHVDCTYTNVAGLVAEYDRIQEIWMWQPAPATVQFTQNPAQPVDNGSQWRTWKRVEAVNALGRLTGNAAYLIRASGAPNSSFAWRVRGRPAPPRQTWTTTGLNFLGFPTPPGNAAPTFDAFFAQSPAIRQALQIFYYEGMDLDETNPHELFNFMLGTRKVRRGEAFWMRAGDLYNPAYGPFEVKLPGSGGFDFSDSLSQISFRVKNVHPATNTITLRLVPSEVEPDGQTPVRATPPVLVRGDLNPTNLTYAYTTLAANGTTTRVLQPAGKPGSEVEIVLGINRYGLAYLPGEFLAAIVRLTDSLGLSQVDLPLSVTVGSPAGLWVGNASVSSVNAYLKSFQKDNAGQLLTAMTPTNGAYIVSSIDTNAAPVNRPFPLRLILHSDATGSNPTLLQRVYHGLDQFTNAIISKREVNLGKSLLKAARRISAPHLPWSDGNAGWTLTGFLRPGQSLSGTVEISHSDQASNPFLHTYHPDHDGLDPLFQNVLPPGHESYTITRKLRLTLQPPANDFASLTASGQQLGGTYAEDMTIAGKGTESRTFSVGGAFSLNRISTIATLTP